MIGAVRAWAAARDAHRRSHCAHCGEGLRWSLEPPAETRQDRRVVHVECRADAERDEYDSTIW